MRNDLVDFTDCQRIMHKAYNGANGKKIAVSYNGAVYMLKFPPSGNNKPTELSYLNSCISEHIGCSIYNILGVTAQETILGYYNVNGTDKLVCACKDFTANNMILYDFCSIKNTIIDSEHNGNGTELEDILETIEKQSFVNQKILYEHFWDMFVIDSFLGNFDRHNGNWGFLQNTETGECSIAPVFDCGSCLLPQIDEKLMKTLLAQEDEMNARIYTFPTSAIKFNNKKINYSSFLMNCNYIGCINSLIKIAPRINLDIISRFIYDIPNIPPLYRTFYVEYITARYNKIIAPAYERALTFKPDMNYDYELDL